MKKVIGYYLKPYYLRMLGGFCIKFIGTIMDLCLPWILAYMIDTIIPNQQKSHIFIWGFVMIVCSILAWTFNVLANQMASRVARDTTRAVRHDLFEKIMYLSNAQSNSFTIPSLISRLTTDTYNLHQMLGRVQRLGVRAPILVIGGVLVTLTLDPVLTLVLLSVMPVITWITIHVSKKSIPMYSALQKSVDRFVRLIREDASGIRVIRALSKEEYEKEKYDELNYDVIAKEKKAGYTMAVVNPSMNFFLNLGLVFVVIVGAYRVNGGLSEVGKILAFLTYFTIILNAMINISKMFVIISKAVASSDRIMEVIDAPVDLLPEICDKFEKENAYLRFHHVDFSYDKVEPNLSDITFSINKGETLGIIGATGSGKSTVGQLMLRFYDPDKGAIYIEGTDIRSFSHEGLRKRFGVVFQNDVLFETSIKENVDMGRNLSDEDLLKAIEYAKAKEFVDQRGYDNHVNIRGANLSGGQKQRLLIARALASNPDFLILDDSSSALDYKTDASLRKELKEHFVDTTTIIIAQRVSSIMYADHIMVLEDGKMIGYGTHKELMNSCSTYQEISHSQMNLAE